MHRRSLSLSIISDTESEAGDVPVARKCSLFEGDWLSDGFGDGFVARPRYRRDEALIDDDDMFRGSRTSSRTLTSNAHEQLSTRNQAGLQHVVDSLAKLKPSNVPHQPPHPQHIPSSLEIAQTNALIADQEVKVAELNTKLDELAREVLLLTQRRDTAAQAARNYRSFVAGKFSSRKCCRTMDSCTFVGIRRVPGDVLAEIFLFYLASAPSCSPWTLTAVSKAFRVTAFSTRRLWCHITITNEHCPRRWMNGSEQCNTLRRLQRALSRAAAAPLDVVVNIRTESVTNPKKERRASKLLRTLVRTSSRWVSLNIQDLSMHDFDFTCLEKDYGSLVSHVTIKSTPQSLIRVIDRSAPNLATLKAERFQIKNFVALSWWSRLTSLSYEAHYQDNNQADRIRILKYITRCTQLHDLTLSMGRVRFTANEIALYNSRSLPHLRKLYFINVNCVMLFECPKLTHLSFKTDHITPLPATTQVIHKRLVYCKVEGPSAAQYLAPLVVPNLQSLCIKAERLDREFRKWWEEHPGKLALRILHLEQMALGVGVLKSTLGKMEGLNILRLWDVQMAKTAFQNFTIKPQGRKSSILCPKLITLDVNRTTLDVRELERILKEVAESRRIAGMPLKSLRYRSSKGTLDLCQR